MRSAATKPFKKKTRGGKRVFKDILKKEIFCRRDKKKEKEDHLD